jgi:single-strand DNA-binding protein
MINKVTLLGNIGQDPEIRTTQGGKELASFSLATSETWKDKTSGEKKIKSEWHKVVIFNDNLVNLVKNYTQKGSKIYLEGKLQTRDWEDKNGNKKYTTEIILNGFESKIVLLDNKGDNKQKMSESDDKAFKEAEDSLDDEIPF